MAKRKTVSVEFLKDYVNKSLAHEFGTKEQRHGMCLVLETALMETGNYRGFQYLDARQVPPGHAPGVNMDERFEDYDTRFEGCDDSRRFYF